MKARLEDVIVVRRPTNKKGAFPFCLTGKDAVVV